MALSFATDCSNIKKNVHASFGSNNNNNSEVQDSKFVIKRPACPLEKHAILSKTENLKLFSWILLTHWNACWGANPRRTCHSHRSPVDCWEQGTKKQSKCQPRWSFEPYVYLYTGGRGCCLGAALSQRRPNRSPAPLSHSHANSPSTKTPPVESTDTRRESNTWEMQKVLRAVNIIQVHDYTA